MFLSRNQFKSLYKLLPCVYSRVSKNYYFSTSQHFPPNQLISNQKPTFSRRLLDLPKQLIPRPIAARGLHHGQVIPSIPALSTPRATPRATPFLPQRQLVTYSKLGKFKPNKAVVARFRLTSTGKVKKWRCRTRLNLRRRGKIIMEECWRAQKIRIMLGKPRYNIRRHHCWID